MAALMNRKNRVAANLLVDFPEITLDTVDISRVISRKDLALYIIVITLDQLNRMDIKSNVLKNPMISQIIESFPDASNIFELYLNGRFEEFQSQMNEIEAHL